MRVYHNCKLPAKPLPAGIKQVQFRWKCPECHERWDITQYRGSMTAARLLVTAWRHRRWARKQTRA